MKVLPLAAESLGVRSMATFVEVGGTGILIDPGVTLAPARFGLPPAEAEWEALRRANDRISAYATRAEIIFVSHYHEDHFRSDPATYRDRFVLAKDPRRMVQGLQARRGQELWRALNGCAKLTPADGVARNEGAWSLEVSPPLPHGLEGTALGYVVALTIVDHAERERFIFASDIQGPLSPVAAAWLRRQRPTLLYLSGPPSYMQHEVGADAIERGIAHLLEVVAASDCRVIMDHHALRDVRWHERFASLWATGRVQTAAGWCGAGEAPLEARRRELWGALRRPAAKAGEGRAIIGRSERFAARTARGGDAE